MVNNMGISLLNELDKVKDKFFLEALAKLTDDKKKVQLYLIYRTCTIIQLWGTIAIVIILGSVLGTQVFGWLSSLGL